MTAVWLVTKPAFTRDAGRGLAWSAPGTGGARRRQTPEGPRPVREAERLVTGTNGLYELQTMATALNCEFSPEKRGLVGEGRVSVFENVATGLRTAHGVSFIFGTSYLDLRVGTLRSCRQLCI